MSKCKTCGRKIHYGYGNDYYNEFEQRVGKISKDSWKKAIEQNCTIQEQDDPKTIHYEVNNIPQRSGNYYAPNNNERKSLFCRLNCLNVFIALHYDYLSNLPNIVTKD